jgi:hypothetical protein
MVSIVKNDTCYPNILRGKTSQGPFSQSMSNIKDYNADPGAKYLETTPNSISVDTLAGVVTVYLFTNIPGWTASADQSWITLIAKNIDNILEVNYTANTNASSRTATSTLSASGIADVTIPFLQNGTSGLQETGSASSIIVYPNPANNEVFVWYSNDYRGGRIEISDISGKRIKTIENISGNVIRVSRNEIAAGIYFVRITGQNNWNGKIIFR